MKKYTDNIENLQESARYTAIDKMLKNEVTELYHKQITNPAWAKGGTESEEPTAIEVLQKMQLIIDKYANKGSHGRLELKSQTEIQS